MIMFIFFVEFAASAVVGTNSSPATAATTTANEWWFLCDCLCGQAAGDRWQISAWISGGAQSTIDVNGQTSSFQWR